MAAGVPALHSGPGTGAVLATGARSTEVSEGDLQATDATTTGRRLVLIDHPDGVTAICRDFTPSTAMDQVSACAAHDGILDWVGSSPLTPGSTPSGPGTR